MRVESKLVKELNWLEKGIKLKEIDGLTEDKLDLNKYYEEFMKTNETASVTIDANANVNDSSIISFYHEAHKPHYKLKAMEWIKRYVGIEAYQAIRDGFIYPHDISKWFQPYCYSFDSAQIVAQGLPFIKGKKIKPPKKTRTYINHHIQALSYICQSIVGAASFPSLLVYLAYYIDKDNLTEKEIEQQLQELIYGLNMPYRGYQTAFTNMSVFDSNFLKDLFGSTVNPDGSPVDLVKVDKLQRKFIDTFIKICEEENLFTFPVLTLCIATEGRKGDKDFKVDEEFVKWAAEVNSKRGSFNIYAGKLGKLSSCCRLILDSDMFSSMLGGGLSIGSTRVSTLNMPMIALESKGNITEFFSILERTLDLNRKVLISQRKALTEAIKIGKHPLYTTGFISLKNQFVTTGFVGLYECIAALGLDIKTEEGSNLAVEILNFINESNSKHNTPEYTFNLEQVPAETAGSVLSKKIKLRHGVDFGILSNQYVPLVEEADLEDRITIQGKLDKLTHGGAIFHLNLDEQIDSSAMYKLIKYVVSKGCNYFAINIGISECSKCGKTETGWKEVSSCCGANVGFWTRIVGYLRPVSNFSRERKKEALNRKWYKKEDLNSGKLL